MRFSGENDLRREKKNPSPEEKGVFQTLPFALTGGFSLLLTFYAGLFIMLAFAYLLENAAALSIETIAMQRMNAINALLNKYE